MNPEAALAVILEEFARTYEGQATLSRATQEWLRGLLLEGYERAIDELGEEGVSAYGDAVQALTTQLVQQAELEMTVDGSTQVSSESIQEVLRRLCPFWPFCR